MSFEVGFLLVVAVINMGIGLRYRVGPLRRPLGGGPTAPAFIRNTALVMPIGGIWAAMLALAAAVAGREISLPFALEGPATARLALAYAGGLVVLLAIMALLATTPPGWLVPGWLRAQRARIGFREPKRTAIDWLVITAACAFLAIGVAMLVGSGLGLTF